MPEPLQDRFEVTVSGSVYTFRIPTIRYDIELGYRSAEIRNKAYPDGMGSMGGLDLQALQFSRYCAMLELYLLKATTLWPYGFADDDLTKVDLNAPPKVSFENFPVDRSEDVWTVGQAFETEVARFRRRRDPNGAPAGA